MKAVIAIDSFKGSMSTTEAGEAAALGIKRVFLEAETIISPLADGGEGTTEAIVTATHGKMRTISVHAPLGNIIDASYGITDDCAVIEMAAASGLTLVPPDKRDPLYTSTYGVGEMILDAIGLGYRKFIIGIGGSATNDGGIGMLSALGAEFLDKNGNPVKWGGIGLSEICHIELSGLCPEIAQCTFNVACDVTNPLCGERGCSAVYAPQKGATPETVELMDGWLEQYADLTKEILPDSDKNFPGSGAAGGLGFAFRSYLGATLRSGIEIVMEATSLEEKIKWADVVITGEGRLDGQSLMGKAPVGVALLAKKYSKPVIAFAGGVTEDAIRCHEYGIDAIFPIVRKPCSLADAMIKENAMKNLADTAEQVFRLLKI